MSLAKERNIVSPSKGGRERNQPKAIMPRVISKSCTGTPPSTLQCGFVKIEKSS